MRGDRGMKFDPLKRGRGNSKRLNRPWRHREKHPVSANTYKGRAVFFVLSLDRKNNKRHDHVLLEEETKFCGCETPRVKLIGSDKPRLLPSGCEEEQKGIVMCIILKIFRKIFCCSQLYPLLLPNLVLVNIKSPSGRPTIYWCCCDQINVILPTLSTSYNDCRLFIFRLKI